MARARSDGSQPDRQDGSKATSSPTRHREVETTLDVGPGWTFPAPEAVLTDAVRGCGADALAPPDTHRLQARYFDTSDLLLARAKITLRRRSGGEDDGWHLKLPAEADAARTEVRLPLRPGPQSPPRALTTLVLATTRGAPLREAATLATTRRLYRVMGVLPPEPATSPDAPSAPTVHEVAPVQIGAPADDQTETTRGAVDGPGRVAVAPTELLVLAEIVDDDVTATAADGSELRWRELEVELVEGSPGLLSRLVDALVAQGAQASPHPSKLRRALAAALAEPSTSPSVTSPATATLPAARSKATAGEVIRAHVAAERDALLAGDALLRRCELPTAGLVDELDAPLHEAVHAMRVATRRIRSALATSRPALEGGSGEPIRAEAAWFASQLSAARDSYVLRGHLLALLRSQREGSLPEVVRARLAARADAGVLEGLAAARAALDHPRYLRLLDALDVFVESPPLSEAAGRPATEVLRERARHDDRRLADAVEAADGARDPEQHAEALHEVRKAAKRARYGAEVLRPVVGKEAARYAKAVEGVQEALGEVQDSVVLGALLREVAAAAVADGQDAFDYGRLHAFGEVRAARAEEDFEDRWDHLSRKRYRRWMG